MRYSRNYYEVLFNKLFDTTIEEKIEELRKNVNVKKYRAKTIKSGDMLECEIYPIWRNNSGGKGKALKESREAQKNLNIINTRKRVVRLTNANFTKKDIWATFTYDKDNLPIDEKQAKKDMENYIRRLRDYIKKNNLPELKYIYVTEYKEDGEEKRVHHHIVMNFADRDKAEEMWQKGGRTHTRRLQPDDYGLEGLARYISKEVKEKKEKKHSKSYCTSKNLIQPKETKSDHKVTKRKVMKIVDNENIACETFEKIYEGYKYNDIEIKLSEYVDGAYLYVRMRRKE